MGSTTMNNPTPSQPWRGRGRGGQRGRSRGRSGFRGNNMQSRVLTVNFQDAQFLKF